MAPEACGGVSTITNLRLVAAIAFGRSPAIAFTSSGSSASRSRYQFPAESWGSVSTSRQSVAHTASDIAIVDLPTPPLAPMQAVTFSGMPRSLLRASDVARNEDTRQRRYRRAPLAPDVASKVNCQPDGVYWRRRKGLPSCPPQLAPWVLIA